MIKCIICGDLCDIAIDGMCEGCFRVDMLCRELAERRKAMND